MKFLKIATAAGFMLTQGLAPAARNIFIIQHRGTTVPGAGTPALSRLTVKELRSMATRLKIKGRSKATRKADLILLIAGKKGAK